ncbi:MAG: hypothetical protein WDN23_20355 [Edaphobacter sp.]
MSIEHNLMPGIPGPSRIDCFGGHTSGDDLVDCPQDCAISRKQIMGPCDSEEYKDQQDNDADGRYAIPLPLAKKPH